MPVKRRQRASPASPAARACHQAGRKFKLRLALGDPGPPPALGEPSFYSSAGSSASESGSASVSLAATPLPPALASTSRRKTRSSSSGSPAADSLDSTASSLDPGETLSVSSLDLEDCSSASSTSRSSSVGLSTSSSSRASSSTAPSEPPSPRSCLKRSLADVALSDPRSPPGQGKRVRWDDAIARSVPTRRGKYVAPPTKRQKRAKLAAEKAVEDPYVEQKQQRARLRRALAKDAVAAADDSTDDDAATSCVAAQRQPPHQTYITKSDFAQLLSPRRVSPADPLNHAGNQRPSSASLPASPFRLKSVALPTDSSITVVVSPPLNAAPPPEDSAADYVLSEAHLSPDWVPRALPVGSAASRADEHAASVEQSPLGMHGRAGGLLIDVPSVSSSMPLSESSAAAAATEPRWDDPLEDVLKQWYDSHEAYGKDGRKGDISVDLTSGAPLRAGDSLEAVARQWYTEYDGLSPGGCFGSA